jgi:hypothetical protein
MHIVGLLALPFPQDCRQNKSSSSQETALEILKRFTEHANLEAKQCPRANSNRNELSTDLRAE